MNISLRYSNIALLWRFLSYALLAVILLFMGFSKKYTEGLSQFHNISSKKNSDQKQLIHLKQLISQQESLLHQYQQLQQQSRSDGAEVINGATWQLTSAQQAKLIAVGDWSRLAQLWQQLSQNFFPWQLDSFNLTPATKAGIFNLNIQFVPIEFTKDPAESEKMIDPFSSSIVQQGFHLNELRWLGALNVNHQFVAYALSPDGSIIAFKKGMVFSDVHWRVTGISLSGIRFEDEAHHLYNIHYGKTMA